MAQELLVLGAFVAQSDGARFQVASVPCREDTGQRHAEVKHRIRGHVDVGLARSSAADRPRFQLTIGRGGVGRVAFGVGRPVVAGGRQGAS